MQFLLGALRVNIKVTTSKMLLYMCADFKGSVKTLQSLHYLYAMEESTGMSLFNPIALRMAKTLWSFGYSECNRVKFCFL